MGRVVIIVSCDYEKVNVSPSIALPLLLSLATEPSLIDTSHSYKASFTLII